MHNLQLNKKTCNFFLLQCTCKPPLCIRICPKSVTPVMIILLLWLSFLVLHVISFVIGGLINLCLGFFSSLIMEKFDSTTATIHSVMRDRNCCGKNICDQWNTKIETWICICVCVFYFNRTRALISRDRVHLDIRIISGSSTWKCPKIKIFTRIL